MARKHEVVEHHFEFGPGGKLATGRAWTVTLKPVTNRQREVYRLAALRDHSTIPDTLDYWDVGGHRVYGQSALVLLDRQKLRRPDIEMERRLRARAK